MVPYRHKSYTIENIGELIKLIRYKLYLTQMDIASYLKVTKQTISLWEKNQSNIPTKKLNTLVEYFEGVWGKFDKTFFFMFRDIAYNLKKKVSFIDYISYIDLTFKEYSNIVKETLNYGWDFYKKLDYTVQGISLNSIKILEKYNQQHFNNKKIVIHEVEKTLGDLFWHIANFCELNELSINDILKRNIEDLKIKYPDKIPENTELI